MSVKLITAKEVAEMIGCSEKTVYSWSQIGYRGIPVYKFGPAKKNLVRFSPIEIQEWIRSFRKEKEDAGNDSC
jgi:predicted DNA-binding transcriptional regulator AlpA